MTTRAMKHPKPLPPLSLRRRSMDSWEWISSACMVASRNSPQLTASHRAPECRSLPRVEKQGQTADPVGRCAMMNAMFPFPFSSLPPGPWRVLGLMSGTSADGTDAVLVEIDPNAYASGQPFRSLLGHLHQPYPSELQTEVLLAAADELKPSQLCKLQA
ncbi:MAG: anhydro-N-acetylmuramic acid kinase, partial [Holophaga sp.]